MKYEIICTNANKDIRTVEVIDVTSSNNQFLIQSFIMAKANTMASNLNVDIEVKAIQINEVLVASYTSTAPHDTLVSSLARTVISLIFYALKNNASYSEIVNTYAICIGGTFDRRIEGNTSDVLEDLVNKGHLATSKIDNKTTYKVTQKGMPYINV